MLVCMMPSLVKENIKEKRRKRNTKFEFNNFSTLHMIRINIVNKYNMILLQYIYIIKIIRKEML